MRIPRAVVRAVAKAKPLIPERAWPALLAARSLRGDGPIIGLPAFRHVLVVAPHPDDESIGCGGLIALLADAGCAIDVVFATDGEATRGSPLAAHELAATRRAEAAAACRILGASAPRTLGLPDGRLGEHLHDLTERLRPFASGADVILVPWFGDGHPDHRAVSDAAGMLGVDGIEVWAYETWTPLPANRLVDITTVIERKESALAAHVTAHLAFDVSATVGLNRYRSIHGLMGNGWAEGFLAAPGPDYAALARDHGA